MAIRNRCVQIIMRRRVENNETDKRKFLVTLEIEFCHIVGGYRAEGVVRCSVPTDCCIVQRQWLALASCSPSAAFVFCFFSALDN